MKIVALNLPDHSAATVGARYPCDRGSATL